MVLTIMLGISRIPSSFSSNSQSRLRLRIGFIAFQFVVNDNSKCFIARAVSLPEFICIFLC
jgi:hypothetical protein